VTAQTRSPKFNAGFEDYEQLKKKSQLKFVQGLDKKSVHCLIDSKMKKHFLNFKWASFKFEQLGVPGMGHITYLANRADKKNEGPSKIKKQRKRKPLVLRSEAVSWVLSD